MLFVICLFDILLICTLAETESGEENTTLPTTTEVKLPTITESGEEITTLVPTTESGEETRPTVQLCQAPG